MHKLASATTVAKVSASENIIASASEMLQKQLKDYNEKCCSASLKRAFNMRRASCTFILCAIVAISILPDKLLIVQLQIAPNVARTTSRNTNKANNSI